MDSKIFTSTLVPEQSSSAIIPRGITPTVAVLIIDGSSSMRQFEETPLNALNGALRILKGSAAARYIAGLVLSFAHDGRTERNLQSIRQMELLTSYNTGHGSRIYRAVMVPLEAMVQAAFASFHIKGRVPFHVDLAVFTDGEDVGSTIQELLRLKEAAAHARSFGWDLNVHGFGVNARHIARQMGFAEDAGHAKSWDREEKSITGAMEEFSRRSARNTSTRTGMLDFVTPLESEPRDTPTPV